MQIIEANIGCEVDGAESKTAHAVIKAWQGTFPNYDMNFRAEVGKTGEQTVIIQTAMSVPGNRLFEFIGRIYRLSVLLEQDCIAVRGHSTLPGELIGPLAGNWGEYDEDYFTGFYAE